MTFLGQDLSPFLGAILIAAVIWFIRMNASNRATERVRQLREAAELLGAHTLVLKRFLDDPAPDAELKRLLIWFSDAMVDREIVERLAEWSASRDASRPLEETDESRRIEQSLAFLREKHPTLADDFAMAIFTAAAGACLRWPESAALFDQAFSRLAITPRRHVAIALTAKSLRGDVPFSLRPVMA